MPPRHFPLVALFAAILSALFGAADSRAISRGESVPNGVSSVRRAPVVTRLLVANGSFETSLSGWAGWHARLARVTGGIDGLYAARVSLSDRSTSFSIFAPSRHIARTTAGIKYSASAYVRSATPGRNVCLRVRESLASNELGAAETCVSAKATWTAFGALTYTVVGAAHKLDVYVYESGARNGDSFDVDGIKLFDPPPPSPNTNVPPVARASSTPTAPFVGNTVNFDASGSTDVDGTIVSYLWNFGDGASATGSTASHVFASAGTYTVTFVVTDDKGAVGSAVVVVPVGPQAPPNLPPTARISSSASSATIGVAITFDGSASSDTDGTVTSYAWRFGDGGSATGPTASRAYGAAGTYTVTLTIADDKAASTSATTTVTVTAPPPASGLTAIALDNAHIRLAWTAVAAATSYQVMRGALVLGTTSGLTFTDALLWPATPYDYSVIARSGSSTVATLNASASTTALPASGFQRPFSPSSFWNTPIGNAPVAPNNAALVSYINSHLTSPNMPLGRWAVAVAEQHPYDPQYTVSCLKYSCTLSAFGAFGIPVTAKQDPAGDGHLAVYDPATQRVWDMWQAAFNGSTWTSSAGAAVSMTGDGVAPAGTQSGDAANFPLLGGIVRPEEILQGHIDHALVFMMPGVNSTGHVCPATHNDGTSSDPNAPKEGMRFQLDPSLDIDSLAIPGSQKTIARALQRYGMYLRDDSGSFALIAENPISRGYDAWTNVGLGELSSVSLSGIPWNRLRAISPTC